MSSGKVRGGCWPPRWRRRSTPTWPSWPASATSAVDAWWCATATRQPRQVITAAGAVEVQGAAGQRQAHRRGNREAQAVPLGDPAAVVPQVAEDHRGAAAAVPARPVHRRLRARAGRQFLGSAAGLSSATVTRLTKQWTDDYRAFCRRDLSEVDYVYVWVDGIHVNVRLEEDKLCLLVIIGVRADGTKELVAMADGLPRVDRVLGRPAA